MSRVTLANPVTSPLLPRMAVMTILAQKREPSLRTRQPSSSTRSLAAARRSNSAGRPRSSIFLRKEAREMQSEDFVCLVTFNTFCAGIPSKHMAVTVEQIDGVFADTLDDGAQPQIVEPQRLLSGALLGGVADEADNGLAAFSLHGLEHDVDGEFSAILAQAEEIESRAHLAGAGMSAVILSVARMAAAETRRHQDLDRLADQLLDAVAEQLFGARVRGPHDAIFVGDENGVRRKFKQPLNRVLGKARLDKLLCSRVLPGGIRGAHVVLPTLAERYCLGRALRNARGADARQCNDWYALPGSGGPRLLSEVGEPIVHSSAGFG